MKKLICAKEIEELGKTGQKVYYIDADTIITPSAKDAAKALGITFSCSTNACESGKTSTTNAVGGGIDSNMIYTVLKAMMDKGQLNGIFDNTCDKPYAAEQDSCGLKIVRGNSVKYEVLDTGNPSDKVFYQEIINGEDGCSMNAGFITIEE